MKMNKKLLGLLGTGHAVTDINQGALSVILTFFAHFSQLQVGAAMLAFNLSSSVIQPLFGVFSDRFRAAWLLPVGCLLAGLGMAATGYTTGYFPLLLAVLVSGLGVAAYHPEGSKFARFASGERKASGMSLFSVGGNFGFAAGPLLAGLFYKLAGLKGTVGFLVLSGVMALLLWLNLSAITRTQTGESMPDVNNPRNRSSKKGLGRGWKYLLPVFILVLVIILRSWIHLGIVTFLPQYYVRYLHHTNTYAAAVVSLFLLAGAVGTLIGGRLADRWGLKTMIMLSMALLIPLLYLLSHLKGFWLITVVALTGCAVVSTFAVTVVFGQELLPHNVGLASGLTLGFGIGMGGVGTTLLGWVADHWGLPAAFHAMIIFPVFGLLLTLLLPGRKELARMNQEVEVVSSRI
ncbi:MAG: transporter, family, fosmidomycin resistance protein [Clostridia bacterium]|nr:transporter, family, fosmidomycin resistance protein [Clostridia bacterium]